MKLQSEDSIVSVAENIPDVICRFSTQFTHLYVNPALEKQTGIPVKNFIGKTPHQAGLPKPFADFWVNKIKQALKEQQQMSFEFDFGPPGAEKHFQSLIVPEFDSQGRLQSILTVTRDITEFKLQQKQKDEFLGMMSHELKNPISSLKGFAQILRKQFLKTQDIDSVSYLSKMDSQLDNLNNLINNLLDATKIKNDKLTFNLQEFDLNKLVKEVCDLMQKTSPKHKMIIKGKAQNEVIGDRERVSQVLINLVSNAIKYSLDNKKIFLHISSDKSSATCCIQDFGVGIAKVDHDKIFDRFYRAGASKQSSSGWGLGLFISKEIIQRLGGKIWVESQLGKGSTFCFTLPLSQDSN